MPPDLEKYLPYVEEFDLTRVQQLELIHSIWIVMEAFADRAFGLLPAYQLPGVDWPDDSLQGPDGIDSNEHLTATHFKRAAGCVRGRDDSNHETA